MILANGQFEPSTILNIRGTNGSGKSTAMRLLMERLGRSTKFEIDGKEAGYRFTHPDPLQGNILVLGKYATACGGLDASFSYPGAADDVIFFLDELAQHGHVVAEGVVAMGSYGIGRLQTFAEAQTTKRNHVIFALMDTPLDVCISRCEARRSEKAAAKGKEPKPLNPENLKSKWDSNHKDLAKLKALGLDTRLIPYQDPLPLLLDWLGI
jgi:Fe-S cluster assembly ATPase SufC